MSLQDAVELGMSFSPPAPPCLDCASRRALGLLSAWGAVQGLRTAEQIVQALETAWRERDTWRKRAEALEMCAIVLAAFPSYMNKQEGDAWDQWRVTALEALDAARWDGRA